MTAEVKSKALNKMLKEMNEKHSGAEDAIHNWLCIQDDLELFEGILKEGRTIKKAMQYVIGKAKKQAEGNAAMIADDIVYGWVKEYFAMDKEPKIKVAAATVKAPKRNATAPPESRAKNTGDEQLSLLDFL